MTNVRKVIEARMKTLRMSKYRLAQRVEPHIAPGTIYDFLRGTSEMTTAKLGRVLDALDLEIVASRTPKARINLDAAGRRRSAGVRK